MDISDLFNPNSKWNKQAGASEAQIRAAEEKLPSGVPRQYLDFLRYSDGGQAFLPIDPWYVAFSRAEDVGSFGYESCLPPFLFPIGSNGGDTILGFDLRISEDPPIIQVGLYDNGDVPPDLVAPDFKAFISMIGVQVAEDWDTIYVQLLNEGTIAFRPVPAEKVTENVYVIRGAEIYNPEDETWEFAPGSRVVVEQQTRRGDWGELYRKLVAIRLAD